MARILTGARICGQRVACSTKWCAGGARTVPAGSAGVRGTGRPGERGDLAAPVRITSYNVCYTKLLRVGVVRQGDDNVGNHSRNHLVEPRLNTRAGNDKSPSIDTAPKRRVTRKEQVWNGSRAVVIPFRPELESLASGNVVVRVRITSYNVCYTKLLRIICNN